MSKKKKETKKSKVSEKKQTQDSSEKQKLNKKFYEKELSKTSN